ncbi:High-affinity branched-chain amino acid transport system permease protein LivH [Methylobacterium crusticola]|uniref:High-affinity branched-chain amino acid transport system permease protein LivH n=1 Tax=Methylobacterium crusticola TaxID=1697972 RepID=A0ABQ4QYJ9_9HYPH|nr:branched-chain amino acid ABC transporter permease [Methylobacterium crusticola]GJD50252.1 High-affinity branched-chain amino acid transport system permease protein LivH [Methylobacterium crusticola]
MSARVLAAVAVVLVGLGLALPALATGYVVYIANLLLVFVVLSLGLHLVIGEAGQFSLAHAAFYGIGIYTAALSSKVLGLPFLAALLAGGVLAALCGLAIGVLSLRMRDIYLALSTFAFGEAMQWVFLNWTPVTGGPNGLAIPPASFLGRPILSDKAAFPVVAGVTLVVIALVAGLHASGLGRAFRAVRESEVAAAAVGIDVRRTKLLAFTLSAFLAGAAGGLFTTFSTFIHPDSLGFQTTILVLTMIVVGGIGSVTGAVGGAVVFGLVSELLRQVPSYQEVIYGGILMLFMMYAPRGVFALVGRR